MWATVDAVCLGPGLLSALTLHFGSRAPGGLPHILTQLIVCLCFELISEQRIYPAVLRRSLGVKQAYESFDHPCVYCLSWMRLCFKWKDLVGSSLKRLGRDELFDEERLNLMVQSVSAFWGHWTLCQFVICCRRFQQSYSELMQLSSSASVCHSNRSSTWNRPSCFQRVFFTQHLNNNLTLFLFRQL